MINLVIFITLWIIATFNYYLVFFLIKNMNGDFYLNSLVYSCTEMLGYAVSGIILSSLGIKLSYMFSFTITIIGALLYCAYYISSASLTPIFLLLASFGMSSSVNIDWNINSTLFPVIYSSSTNGICNIFARITDSMAP